MARTKDDGQTATAIGPNPTNGAQEAVEDGMPYTAYVKILGVADMLLHRWNCEEVEAKGKAAKGSKAKKSDNVESYVYRDEDGFLAIPGEYLRQSILGASKFRQDPRSPRKCALDLFKAGIVCMTPLATIGPVPTKAWSYEDRRRVTVQRNAITRIRPAILSGWTLEIALAVLLPEYIQPAVLTETIGMAGRLIGIADFRPTYGRFTVTGFEVRNV